MAELNIFDYDRFCEYFAAYVHEEKKQHKAFSYRYLASRLKFKSPSALLWMAKGTRLPSPDFLLKLRDYMGWQPNEYAYAQALVGLERAKNPEERKLYLERLKQIRPATGDLTIMDRKIVEAISHWHCVAILEMTHLVEFKNDSKWISERLGHIVTIEEVEHALTTLSEVGLIRIDKDSTLVRLKQGLRTPPNVPIQAVRSFHCEMMKLAQSAVYMQEPDERYFSGLTLSLNSKRLKEAQTFLADSTENFVELMHEPGDQVYHLAVQFFRLTATTSSSMEVDQEDTKS